MRLIIASGLSRSDAIGIAVLTALYCPIAVAMALALAAGARSADRPHSVIPFLLGATLAYVYVMAKFMLKRRAGYRSAVRAEGPRHGV